MLSELRENLEEGKSLIFVIVTFLFGIGFIIAGIVWNSLEEAVKTWPETEGFITSSKVTVYDDDEDDSYTVKIKYTYSINETDYGNDDFSTSGIGEHSRVEAEEILLKYMEGTEVIVHYNPEKPEDSYLFIADEATGKEMISGGFIWLSIGLAVFIITCLYYYINSRLKK